MHKVFITSGMLFGDEGKGTFIDYLAHEHGLTNTVRYGGGAQARHTVTAPSGLKHSFSQLGSGMLLPNSQTYLMGNMVINPMSLVVEAMVFAETTGSSVQEVLDRVVIDGDCLITMPYHQVLCRLREFCGHGFRRGRVGSGTSDVRPLWREEKLGLTMQELMADDFDAKVVELMEYVRKFYDDHRELIHQHCPADMQSELVGLVRSFNTVDEVIDHYHRLISDFVFKVKDVTSMMPGICRDGAVFETSQGLMIDEHYGTRPHTTRVDTTNNYAIRLTDSLTDDVMLQKIGITKALASRHGMGAFPTEDGSLAAMVCDENQLETFWAGNVRWGWFDAVLTRYAQRVNQVDELYVSCLDYLDRFETIKICQAYSYSGLIDDDFKATFNFEPKASGCIVYDIKRPSEKMSKYLSQCQPIYQTVAGWQQDTTRVKEAQQLPQQCLGYLERITELTGVKVSVVSVGPTRNQKVVIV